MVTSHKTHYPVQRSLLGLKTSLLHYAGLPTYVELLAKEILHPVKAQRRRRYSFCPPTNLVNKNQCQYCTVPVCTKHALQFCPNCVGLKGSNQFFFFEKQPCAIVAMVISKPKTNYFRSKIVMIYSNQAMLNSVLFASLIQLKNLKIFIDLQ